MTNTCSSYLLTYTYQNWTPLATDTTNDACLITVWTRPKGTWTAISSVIRDRNSHTSNQYFSTAKLNAVHLTGATYGRAALKFSWLIYALLRDLYVGVLSFESQQQRRIMSSCTVPHYTTRVVDSICYISNKRKWLLSVRQKMWDLAQKEVPLRYHVSSAWLQLYSRFHFMTQRNFQHSHQPYNLLQHFLALL